MKAIFIDAKNGKVSEVQLGKGFTEINKLIGCETFCCGARLANGDFLFVDDEGLINDTSHFFLLEEIGHPLMGNAVIVGPDDEEGDNSKDVVTTVEYIESQIHMGIMKPIGEIRIEIPEELRRRMNFPFN